MKRKAKAPPEPPRCLACRRALPKVGRATCPVCGHVFRGRGWDGIDAHWRARHLDVMPYREFWESLCDKHRAAEPRECPCCRKGIPPDVAFRQCPECALVLKGPGWSGIDAHWGAHHAASMTYDEFWQSLCPAHRGVGDPQTGYIPFEPER